MQKLWFLEEVDLYKILCPTKVKAFEKDHFKWYRKGDFIYFQNERAEKVFLVSRGRVKIVRYNEEGDEIVHAILQKGEIFGEMALMGASQRDDIAIAGSDQTALCAMNVDQMYQLMRDNQRFELTILKVIGLKLKKLERRLDQLFFKDAKTRLIELIHDFYESYGLVQEQQILIKHHCTQQDIADLIGTRRETVSTLLKEMKAANLLDYQNKQLTIFKPEYFGIRTT